jgi:hypothetical protein
MWHVWERGEVNTEDWWENLKEGDYLQDLGIDGMDLEDLDKGTLTFRNLASHI